MAVPKKIINPEEHTKALYGARDRLQETYTCGLSCLAGEAYLKRSLLIAQKKIVSIFKYEATFYFFSLIVFHKLETILHVFWMVSGSRLNVNSLSVLAFTQGTPGARLKLMLSCDYFNIWIPLFECENLCQMGLLQMADIFSSSQFSLTQPASTKTVYRPMHTRLSHFLWQ